MSCIGASLAGEFNFVRLCNVLGKKFFSIVNLVAEYSL